ncbi:MAG: RagB/SusD family nutrient uptake outer membrane protein [Phaeodactylibacter sp.]|nr:RagB/SusD family nutrient uptake outer membrane protein [Phaeodactylibacter sp.]MCB9273128.1 RagB/SusD family nutrient uptake outer membrane protein [Lewinellaceae bacterium]
MKNIKYLLLLLLTTGCADNLDITNPNQLTTDDYWETPAQALAGVNAIYNSMLPDGAYMRMYPSLNDGRGDDIKGDSPWADLVQVANFTIPTTSGPVQWVWRENYQMVWRANQVLANVPDIEMEDGLKNRLLGQAYFLRGLAYFNLANMFKVVPVITSLPTTSEDFNPPTAPEEELWAQIFSDFQEAGNLLPASYNDVSGPDQGQLGRATKGAAIGFLGKAHLYRKNWQSAADALGQLINGPLNIYSLVPNYRDNFTESNENNSESVFEVQFAHPDIVGGSDMNWAGEPNANWKQVSAQAVTYGMDERGFSDFLPTQWIYEEYKMERTVDGHLDPRLLATIASYEPDENSTTIYGDPWPYAQDKIYPRKYTRDGFPGIVNEFDFNSGINYRLMRYADVLLMYAEAMNELGKTADAYPYIQEVRDRAMLPGLATVRPNMSQEEMRGQLAHERALEFASEAIRINDIIRWGWLYDNAKLEMLKSHDAEFNTWTPGNEYLPVPQRELDINPNLSPNPAN